MIEKLYTGEHILLLCSRLRVFCVFFLPAKSEQKSCQGGCACFGSALGHFEVVLVFLYLRSSNIVLSSLGQEMNEKVKVLEVDDCSGM